MNELRKCCGVEPEWVEEFYPNTKYRMWKIRCPKCGVEIAMACRKKDQAVWEWNHPLIAKIN